MKVTGIENTPHMSTNCLKRVCPSFSIELDFSKMARRRWGLCSEFRDWPGCIMIKSNGIIWTSLSAWIRSTTSTFWNIQKTGVQSNSKSFQSQKGTWFRDLWPQRQSSTDPVISANRSNFRIMLVRQVNSITKSELRDYKAKELLTEPKTFRV